MPGATYGIFTAVATLVRPGDEVILFEPAYDCYAPAIEVNGGVPVYVQLRYPDYGIDWQQVQRAITPRTRAIIINTPNNPTASVFSGRGHADARGHAARNRYRRDQRRGLRAHRVRWPPAPERRPLPGLAERSYVVSSFGKTYHVTGWKMGYVLAPKELMTEFRKVHQFNVFVTNSPLQHAFAEFMENPEAYLSLAAFYQRKRDFFLEGIKGSRFKPLPSRGTFFQNLCYDAVSEEQDMDLAIRLTKEHGVASIPVSVFYREPPPHRVLRFCFAKSEETLARGAEILCKI